MQILSSNIVLYICINMGYPDNKIVLIFGILITFIERYLHSRMHIQMIALYCTRGILKVIASLANVHNVAFSSINVIAITLMVVFFCVFKRRIFLSVFVHKSILSHDNVRPHSSRQSAEHLDSFKLEIFNYPPHHSQDLALFDYHLFTKLKRFLGSLRFNSDNELSKQLSKLT